ncbi:MAG: hypothetical protein Q3974_05845 [Rothia sp. (in: high G+C Gram-positive bacteria)]|nr:hypothetical protein [Rothia sp. (in: high G+C Gram-positive bacteria)]
MNANDNNKIGRRNLAKGALWAAPVIVSASTVPAYAVSTPDVIVMSTSCSDGAGGLNNIPFTVRTAYRATLPVGTVFVVDYAGGSTTPTWSGLLANNSNVTITPGNDTSTNGGRWGKITFTLKNPMPADTTWNLNISMDIGALITGQQTSLTLNQPVSTTLNSITSNDTASHEMYFGGCRN